MKTFREKFTFSLTALAYLVFHIRTGSSTGSMIAGTVEQLLTTAPYCIGFTWVLVAIIRYMHKGKWPAWDRIARIFFTIGILFAFYFALYEYGDRGHQEQVKLEKIQEQERVQNHQEKQEKIQQTIQGAVQEREEQTIPEESAEKEKPAT